MIVEGRGGLLRSGFGLEIQGFIFSIFHFQEHLSTNPGQTGKAHGFAT